MSYAKQMLARPGSGMSELKEGEEEHLGEELNMDNLNELGDLEFGDIFDKTRHSEDMEEFKTTFKYRDITLERAIRVDNSDE
jgi:hypothetical protein